MRALFTLTIFVGSFLLFLVEPMVAKMILPTFGGSPQVWNASVLFFQIALLLGYLYAHWAPRTFAPSRQPTIHIGVLILAGLVLPFSTHSGFFGWIQNALAGSKAADTTAGLWVLVALAGLVGLPFFVLSSGASLLQHWFSYTKDPKAKDPYFLYSASNLGSLLGLFAYPFLLEPRLTIPQQARIWAYGYAALIVLIGLSVLALHRYLPKDADQTKAAPVRQTDRRSKLLWTLLSAVPSSLMLGATTYLTSNIAPVPLLWVVPLALYLVTFILAFARWGDKPLPLLSRIAPILVTALAVILILDVFPPDFAILIGSIHLMTFFVCAWLCHSRLASLRPEPQRLTEFYFYVALGGAIGGAFNSLLAPLVFNNFYEYPLALVAACLLRPRREGESVKRMDWLYPLGVGVVALLLMLVQKRGLTEGLANTIGWQPSTTGTIVGVGIPLILAFVAVDRSRRFGLAIGAVFLASMFVRPTATNAVLLTRRSFFGIHRVSSNGRFNTLVHGNTVHGMQDREHPETPLTYYYPNGPIGQVFSARKDSLKDVALVGLGVGSLAAYGQPGMRMTYFEIDPVVEQIARDPRYFTFLRDTKANLDVVLGDARLTLSRSNRKYDLIALDAFSSDAIPVHLLTREAMQMYLDHLRTGGLIAFHTSNRFLELDPTLAATGATLNLPCISQLDPAIMEEKDAGKTESDWIVFARSKEDLKQILNSNSQWGPEEPEPSVRPWTDDFSNVLSIFQPNQ